jgi:hypothetical protein
VVAPLDDAPDADVGCEPFGPLGVAPDPAPATGGALLADPGTVADETVVELAASAAFATFAK